MRVLHAIHDFLPRHRAGSEIYADALCRALARRGHDVAILCAEFDSASPHGLLRQRDFSGLTVFEIVNNWAFRSFSQTWAPDALKSALAEALTGARPDVVHAHSLLNLSFELPALARARGIPTVATLHDYTLVCPSGGQRLHRAEAHVCATIEPERCARCFPESPAWQPMGAQSLGPFLSAAIFGGRLLKRFTPAAADHIERQLRRVPTGKPSTSDIEQRLLAARRIFNEVDQFVAPSRHLADEYVRLGFPTEQLEVSSNGQVPLAHQGPVPRGGPVRIGFIGSVVWHKGAHVLIEACRALPEASYRLLVFGDLRVDPLYAGALRAAAGGIPVEFRGRFDARDTARVYGELDVVVVPSLWPENSPLVVHEAFQAGVPVVAARMGGLGELLGDGTWGPLYDARSPAELHALLAGFVNEPARLTALAAALPAVKGIDDDARDWERRYERALTRVSSSATA